MKIKDARAVMLMVRSRFEIMTEILSLCKQPQGKTKVMYGTNLSWKMVQKYLSQLQSWGLLEVHHSSTKYATTRKGLKFIEKWRELAELFCARNKAVQEIMHASN